MVREHLRAIPDDQVDVTLPVTIDALRYIDPADPAMPMYRVIANNGQPVALGDLMIAPRKLAFTNRALLVSANCRPAPEFAFPVRSRTPSTSTAGWSTMATRWRPMFHDSRSPATGRDRTWRRHPVEGA